MQQLSVGPDPERASCPMMIMASFPYSTHQKLIRRWAGGSSVAVAPRFTIHSRSLELWISFFFLSFPPLVAFPYMAFTPSFHSYFGFPSEDYIRSITAPSSPLCLTSVFFSFLLVMSTLRNL
ncbi:hypothetical protein F5Y17DRAFT_440751 [Xylariaceae sp. FL0594]|nr:hypothetical protein F5Y17DRAFT_440751 [Xylariaceae sp. FL0594]